MNDYAMVSPEEYQRITQQANRRCVTCGTSDDSDHCQARHVTKSEQNRTGNRYIALGLVCTCRQCNFYCSIV